MQAWSVRQAQIRAIGIESASTATVAEQESQHDDVLGRRNLPVAEEPFGMLRGDVQII